MMYFCMRPKQMYQEFLLYRYHYSDKTAFLMTLFHDVSLLALSIYTGEEGEESEGMTIWSKKYSWNRSSLVNSG